MKYMPPEVAYQETIDYLYGLQKHGIKFGLNNTVRLMGLMGSPHRRFRSVHVAGTNGKGSTAAFIASMLRAAGFRIGLYTSPHLVSFTERIRVNETPISESRVVEITARVRAAYEQAASSAPAEGHSPTFFEVTTAVAFVYFAEEQVDLAVVEVGMGGRLDATNVVTPLASVITNIDIEHTEFLGNTLPLIAAEKAGIIKQGVPVVTGVSQPEALDVLLEKARAMRAPVHRLGVDFRPEAMAPGVPEQRFRYSGPASSYDGLKISLPGRYQVDNACMALAAIECITAAVRVPEEAVRKGLEQARWEGRLERVAQRPDIYLDGAHNPAAARMLSAALKDLRKAYGRLVLVIGILGDKDFRGVISELVPLADSVIATKPAYSRALEPAALARDVRAFCRDVTVAENLDRAIAEAKRQAGPGDLILITGSLYVVGDAKAVMTGQGSQALSRLKG